MEGKGPAPACRAWLPKHAKAHALSCGPLRWPVLGRLVLHVHAIWPHYRQERACIACLPADLGKLVAFSRRSASMRCVLVPCPQLAAYKLAADDMRRRFKGNISRQVGGGRRLGVACELASHVAAACHMATMVPPQGNRQ